MASPGNPVSLRFGRNLAAARKRLGLSQEDVGIRASLHRTEIGLLERGERVPRIDTAVKLAGSVEASVADLLTGIEWTPGSARRGEFLVESRRERRAAVRRRAAEFGARHAGEVDPAELAREAREELEERGERREGA